MCKQLDLFLDNHFFRKIAKKSVVAELDLIDAALNLINFGTFEQLRAASINKQFEESAFTQKFINLMYMSQLYVVGCTVTPTLDATNYARICDIRNQLVCEFNNIKSSFDVNSRNFSNDYLFNTYFRLYGERYHQKIYQLIYIMYNQFKGVLTEYRPKCSQES